MSLYCKDSTLFYKNYKNESSEYYRLYFSYPLANQTLNSRVPRHFKNQSLYILHVLTKPACPFVVSPALSFGAFWIFGGVGGLNSILLSVCLSVPSFFLIPHQNIRIHFNESLFRLRLYEIQICSNKETCPSQGMVDFHNLFSSSEPRTN